MFGEIGFNSNREPIGSSYLQASAEHTW